MPPVLRFRSVRGRFAAGILLVSISALATLAILEDRYVTRLLEALAVSAFSEDALSGAEAIQEQAARAEMDVLRTARIVGHAETPSLARVAGDLVDGPLALVYRTDARGRVVEAVPLRADLTPTAPRRLPPLPVPPAEETALAPWRLAAAGRYGNTTLAVAAGLPGGPNRGAVVGVIDPSHLFQWVAAQPVSGRRETFVVDAAGHVVAFASEATRPQTGARVPAQLPFARETVTSILHGDGGIASGAGPSLVAYALLDEGDERAPRWAVGVAMPRALVLASVDELRRYTLYVLAATVVLALALALLLARQITRPLAQLQAGAERVASGDLDTAVAADTRDEVGKVAESVEIMRRSLRGTLLDLDAERRLLEQRVIERTAQLAARGEELARANESLRSLDRLKSDFITNVSHELRTPLTMLLATLDLIESTPEANPQQAAELLAIAASGAHRLARIVDRVLEYADADAGPPQWMMETVGAPALLAGVEERLAGLAADRRVSLTLTVAPDAPHVDGSEDHLVGAIAHLVRNALTFTPAGGRVEVVAEGGPGRDTGRSLAIHVRDTGPGLEPSQVRILFDRFAQGGDVLTEKPHGLGLGLAIAHRVVDHHHGTIRVESRPGEGSVFTIVLPAAPFDASSSHAA